MPDTTVDFTPAREYSDRHGLFVALVGDTNSGKTYSSMRLCKGIAEAQGKRFAVLDTEGGRTLHLRKEFDFDFIIMDPPHRPMRYLELAERAQTKGYGALLIDSFSQEWRGTGGVLDWQDEKVDAAVARRKAWAERSNEAFNEEKARDKARVSARAEPIMSHKFMVLGMLGLRIPIVFAIRGGLTFDPKVNKEVFKAQMRRDFLFDVTCSFRLAQSQKGIIDLSDAQAWKMEGDHRSIFKNGDQISERHGAALNAWATNAPIEGDRPRAIADQLKARVEAATTEEQLADALGGDTEQKQMAWLKKNRPELFEEVTTASSAKFKALQPGGDL